MYFKQQKFTFFLQIVLSDSDEKNYFVYKLDYANK